MLCVSQATLRVSVVVSWLGRCGGLTRKVGCLPTLRGGPPQLHANHSDRPLGAHAEGVPDCSSYLLRIPWIARRWVVGPRTRVSCLIKVSAADELQHSTEVLRLSLSELRRKLNPLARGLERLLSPAGDRFETASSKFRWNPSPLLPLMHTGKMEPENHAMQTRHSGWLGQLSLDLLVAKEPQNPHSGSKLTVSEQPLITRPRTLEKPVLTS